jgi:exodeoxyribonuclease VII small subunit
MAEKEKNNELENMSFEDAINELEKIVDEAVNAYERGSKLKNICQERLNEAKMKVEKIKDFDKDEI